MAKVTFIKTDATKLVKVPVKEGQIIFLSDGAIYVDMNGTRINLGTSIEASEITDGLFSSEDKKKINLITYDENSNTVTFA